MPVPLLNNTDVFFFLQTMGVPKIAVFVPDNEDDMYFFRRMATELPPLLADRASVFISVAHAHTQEVSYCLKSQYYFTY